ncbi:hypothetical protein ETB97_009301 [Aspergillus alliaceus]|uniref:Uncharacterized protein n=1 Tax=Petromyces alliaceus TaxID=209559 RepID=A0A8H6E9R1_PETAA|nr:hypothetical protein ETB97_009301 [Aspergillus burnettii]
MDRPQKPKVGRQNGNQTRFKETPLPTHGKFDDSQILEQDQPDFILDEMGSELGYSAGIAERKECGQPELVANNNQNRDCLFTQATATSSTVLFELCRNSEQVKSTRSDGVLDPSEIFRQVSTFCQVLLSYIGNLQTAATWSHEMHIVARSVITTMSTAIYLYRDNTELHGPSHLTNLTEPRKELALGD